MIQRMLSSGHRLSVHNFHIVGLVFGHDHLPKQTTPILSPVVLVMTTVVVVGAHLTAAAAVSSVQVHTGLLANAVWKVTVWAVVPPVASKALSVPPAVIAPASTVGFAALPDRTLLIW